MKFINDNKGIVLVTSLMITMLSLVIVMSLMLMIINSIKASSQLKKYKTALDASYGGVEIVVKDILPTILQNFGNANFVSNIESDFNAVALSVASDQNCLQSKLTSTSLQWPNGCSNTADPKVAPDITFNLAANVGANFKIYSKIVETTLGNSDTSGLQLEGSGVAESSSLLKPKHYPYIYRLEIQGERENSPTAQANIEVLYAY